MRHFLSVSAAAGSAIRLSTAMAAVSASAAATEYCVTCEGPAAEYACTFDGAAGTASDTRLKLLCITELAKAGQHASCSVDRQQQTPCKGAVRQLAMPSGMDIDVPPSAADAGATPVLTPSAKPEPAPQTDPVPTAVPPQPPPAATDDPTQAAAPPTTVKEAVEKGVASTEKAIEEGGNAAGEAAKATGSTLEKAGKAVGNAAKKTWDCITSFGDC